MAAAPHRDATALSAGSPRPIGSPGGDLLVCRISAGCCTVAVDLQVDHRAADGGPRWPRRRTGARACAEEVEPVTRRSPLSQWLSTAQEREPPRRLTLSRALGCARLTAGRDTVVDSYRATPGADTCHRKDILGSVSPAGVDL
jgi:hypothetical protein